MILRRSNQSLDFTALRRVRRQSTQKFLRGRGGFGGSAGPREGDRQIETCLVEVGIDREGTLKRNDGIRWMTAIRQRDPEIGGNHRVAGLNPLRISQRCAG